MYLIHRLFSLGISNKINGLLHQYSSSSGSSARLKTGGKGIGGSVGKMFWNYPDRESRSIFNGGEEADPSI